MLTRCVQGAAECGQPLERARYCPGMTGQEFIELVAGSPLLLMSVFGLELATAYGIGRVHAPGLGGIAPWKYAYAVLVYAACVPGVLAALLTAYTILFLRGNLLEVNILRLFCPHRCDGHHALSDSSQRGL